MKKLAPHVQLIKTDVFDENLLDFLENIEEFSSKMQIQSSRSEKQQQKPQVVDIKQLKKKQKGLF